MRDQDLGDRPVGRVSRGAADGARIVLYVRAACHLCEDARAVVTAVAAQTGATWAEVDVDTVDDGGASRDAYGELVPVVTVDGVRQGYWRLDADRLRRALAGT